METAYAFVFTIIFFGGEEQNQERDGNWISANPPPHFYRGLSV